MKPSRTAKSLTSIEILANVKTIGNNVFSLCKSLKTVDMSACTQVETIGQYAFYKDSELRLFKIGTGRHRLVGRTLLRE